MLAAIIVIGLCSAAVIMIGVLVAMSRQTEVTLGSPLKVYPVEQQMPGACPAGPGINGPEGQCYKLLPSGGLEIKKVAKIEVEQQQDGTYGVAIQLLSDATDAFANLTKSNLQRQLVLVMNNSVITAPKVDAPILGGRMLIVGQYTFESANRLATSLTGAPAPIITPDGTAPQPTTPVYTPPVYTPPPATTPTSPTVTPTSPSTSPSTSPTATPSGSTSTSPRATTPAVL